MIRSPGVLSLRSSLYRIYPALSMLALVGLWQIAANATASAALPGPSAVLTVLAGEVLSGNLFHHLGATLSRLAVSFVLAMSLGSALGMLLGRHPRLDRFFDVWVMLFLNVPALVIIILCYVWFGLGEAAAVTAVVVNKLPNVVVTLREGTRALDRNLLEMAESYRFGRIKTLRHVIAPQLFPFFVAASRNGVALIWKIILVVEILGRSDGMGYRLHLFFQMFDVAGILAYTIAFVGVIQLIEWAIFKPMEARAMRWRR